MFSIQIFCFVILLKTAISDVNYEDNSDVAWQFSGSIKGNGTDKKWWEEATFYQIYPRSFKDNDNDGTGDLKGVIEKLQYIKDTGITAVWLSPIFKSPQVDQGYDISDYKTIDPLFGTMKDFEDLLKKAKEVGVKVILDFVPNHTSDKHQWFINSVNRVPGYEDFYVWHNGSVDQQGKRIPPNNWISLFKGSAWTWNEKRKQWYLHQFADAQPDLNYRSPSVVNNMTDILYFWLDKGVDGFRIDAVPYLFEDPKLQDEPKSINYTNYEPTDYEYLDHIYTKDLNETYNMIYYFREVMDKYTKDHKGEDRIIMTEAYTTYEKTLLYFANADGSRLGAHFSFNFDLITELTNTSTDIALDFAHIILKWYNQPDYIHYNWVQGNHDQHRVATRFGQSFADGLNMAISLLIGIQVTYNGEEIAMENGPVKCEEGRDPAAIKNCSTFDEVSRDFERTPFQWDKSTNAGFNKGAKTWLPVNPKYVDTNLASQQNVPNSHYEIYKKLQEIRKDLKKPFDHASYDVGYLGKNLFQTSRIAFDEFHDYVYYYIVVFNMNEAEDVANLFVDNVYTLKVLLAGGNSSRKIGDVVSAKNLRLSGHEALLLTFNS